ncbi:MAG TPA: hypothetical protein VKP69_25510, partial [Isosphaeraceae bacterium]|nr:hypothetical protein [Isosphaeraceae bacterium]
NCKQLLGLEDPANRLPKAVARTAPMALMIYPMFGVKSPSGHRLSRGFRLFSRVWRAVYVVFFEKRSDNINAITRKFPLFSP